MDQTLIARWNQVKGRLLSTELLENKGLGNEIGFHIFDYLPEFELDVREHLKTLVPHLQASRPDLKIHHIQLFDFTLQYLEDRKLLPKVLKMQKDKGNAAVQKALKGPLKEEKIAELIRTKIEGSDLVLLSGVGSIWPLLRTHTLLSALHPVMGQTPLVMFYPGNYDGTHLSLFDKLDSRHYYRAFKL
ncbi:MAG: hypothetical protein ACI86H_002503, partial [bacterium]